MAYRYFHEQSIFSFHHEAEFKFGGYTFHSVYQFYGFRKAVYFNDMVTADAILRTKVVSKQKMLSNTVKNYDDQQWRSECRSAVKSDGSDDEGKLISSFNSAILITSFKSIMYLMRVYLNCCVLFVCFSFIRTRV